MTGDGPTPDTPSVLLVDDEFLVAKLYARAVQAMGFRARIAGTAGQALEEIEGEPPSLLLTDLNLPDFSGLTLVEKLGDKNLKAFPCILMSADDSVPLMLNGLKIGMDDFLYKGIAFSQLTERLRFWVDGPFRALPAYIRAQALQTMARFSPFGQPFHALRGSAALLTDRVRVTLVDQLAGAPEGFGMSETDRLRFLGAMDGMLDILCKTNGLAQLRRPDVMLSIVQNLRVLWRARLVEELLPRYDLLASTDSTFRHARQTLSIALGG
ncbi:MAG: response regulator [Sphingomonadales bacterium]|nr:MAG: response regulator [Sphingomonadales bacterium]